MIRLEEERAEDLWEVEALYDLCFAPGREALSSYRLRDGVAKVPDLCLTARDEAGILGAAIRYWPVTIAEPQSAEKGDVDTPRAWHALLLGPVAVHPTRQGEGLGALLINESLALARGTGWFRAMLVGDAPYYARFGFTRLAKVEMPPPTNPERVLGLDLVPGAWSGVRGQVGRSTLNEFV
ncbi:N-acetyltransferase [Mesobaculum littorinae]|uniref:N-acetyltransferase n=1 Tax=Mesobaculum littorinae TaxID=2486419 RepID=A0A438AIM8_9RHOB|nr:N-acetyltransferase [Mesobaculum littorinae]RVV98550.1 N-acetyltransferase [Mesobaculum littorinae]